MTLGQRIMSELKRNGMSMRSLARAIDSAQPTVFKWVHDMNEPSLKSLKKMAEVFNVSPNWLLYGDEVERTLTKEEAPSAAMIISERRINYLNSSTCLYFQVDNDEMSPTLEAGSTVIVDRTVTSINQSGIYLIEVSSEMILRRFRRSIDGSVRVSCDNSAKYPEVEVLANDDDLKILGRVVSKVSIQSVN